MIRKTLLYTGLLFMFYNLLVAFLNPYAHIPLRQNQWQDNHIKAQEYLYRAESSPVVVVGSSLASCLQNKILTDSVYNLSFRGGSIYTGLEIIKRAGKKPRMVLVEINVVGRNSDNQMVHTLFTPVVSTIKAYLPALQEKNRPVLFCGNVHFYSYLVRSLKKIIQQKVILLLPSATSREVPALSANVSDAPVDHVQYVKLFEDKIAGYKKSYQQVPEADMKLDQLAGYIGYLTRQQIKVVFFEMPIEAELRDLPYPAYIRRQVRQAFPGIPLIAADTLVSYKYSTTDGLHMNEYTAEIYTTYFRTQIGKISK